MDIPFFGLEEDFPAGARPSGAWRCSSNLDSSPLERYEDSYRLCSVRGPEGIIVELAEHIS
jgi:hypothetical protein